MPAAHLITGARGEEIAASFLQTKGYIMLARNWRSKSSRGKLELDCIFKYRNELIFVEVKTRKECGLQRPYEAVTPAKQRNLITAAHHYLTENDAWQHACRFDVIAVYTTQNSYRVEHIENAFDLSEPVGCSHTSWQPW